MHRLGPASNDDDYSYAGEDLTVKMKKKMLIMMMMLMIFVVGDDGDDDDVVVDDADAGCRY